LSLLITIKPDQSRTLGVFHVGRDICSPVEIWASCRKISAVSGRSFSRRTIDMRDAGDRKQRHVEESVITHTVLSWSSSL